VIVRYFCFFLLCVAIAVAPCYAQKEVTYSLGVFAGATSTFTFDEGINKDPRYQAKYGADFVPFGVHAGIDFDGFGFMIDPQVMQLGQSFNILNSAGGQVGDRKVSMTYLQLPFSLKKHIIDLSFFKVSWVMGASYGLLLNASERITHSNSKLTFPATVYNVLPTDYQVEYDGVVSPAVNNLKTLQKTDFKASQFFGSVGIRSDWDVTEHARLSFDFRGNIAAFDPRSSDYLQRSKDNLTIYEIFGRRVDAFASLTLGYSRYLFVEKKAKVKKVKPFQQYGPKRRVPK
jgi:hypothetical protein